MTTIELELGTAVALDVRGLELPPDPGFELRPTSRGATIDLPADAPRRSPARRGPDRDAGRGTFEVAGIDTTATGTFDVDVL